MTRQLDITPGLSSSVSANYGFVYFIQADECGPIKIGWSAAHPFGRMEGFQCGNHHELTLLAYGPGSKIDEHDLHRQFATSRIRGEWFKPTKGVLSAAKKFAKRMEDYQQTDRYRRRLYVHEL